MDKIMYENFRNVCRTCSENCDIKINQDSVILDIYYKLTEHQFEANEELPKQICLKCYEEINRINTFALKCKETHSKLMDCLINYKNVRIKEEPEFIIEELEIKDEITIDEHKFEFIGVEDDSNNELKIKVEEDVVQNVTPVSLNTEVELNAEVQQNKNDFFNSYKPITLSQKPENEAEEVESTNISTNINDEDSHSSTTNLEFHQNHETLIKPQLRSPYECEVCAKTFKQIGKYRNHVRVHSDERPYKCEQCPKSFKQSNNLIVHKRVHSGEHPHKCNECDKTFVRSSTLKAHKLIHTGKRMFECDECDKTFIQSGTLRAHKLAHTGIRMFQCDECDKSFMQSSTLKAHKLRHSGIRMFECDQCEKSFNRTYDLSRHKLVHSGERPCKCDQCPKSFKQSKDLKEHKLVHSGERPYNCDQCNKSFRHTGNLKTHKRLHCKRRYKCDQCKKSFKQMSGLVYHRRMHCRTDDDDDPLNLINHSGGLGIHDVDVHSGDDTTAHLVNNVINVPSGLNN